MADFTPQGMPPFINRMLSLQEWAAYVAGYDFGPVAPTRLVLHHTYIPNQQQWSGLNSMKGMQSYYASLGWTAAPHVYAGPDGVWLATPMSQIGIHAGTGNSGYVGGKLWYSIGLEMVGYFDHELPAGAVWEHAKAVMGGLSKRLNIAPRQLISFHRDYTNQKSCPGWAVTKEWVFGEVEAWLNNQPPPPPPPPGQIGSPRPEVEQLIELLMGEAYKRRGTSYNSDWAFHQFAVQNGLGFPIGPSATLSADGKTYSYQPFARDTLYNEVPNWGDVHRLSELLAGSLPPAGLGRALLEATYQAGGAALHPDWAFHQTALASKYGPPLGESATLTLDGVQYSYQVFALETLYNVVPNWSDVRRLSELANSADAAQVRLRDALLAQVYARGGATYHPEWAFHQIARGLNLGAPLSDSYRVSQGSSQYAIQVYATDVLYNVVPNWSEVKRLSDSVPGLSASLGGEAGAEGVEVPADLSALLLGDAQMEPAPAPFHIVHYEVPYISGLPYSSRSGSRIKLLVLHGDPGPAKSVLASMRALGSRSSTNYYLAADGTIYQVVPDEYAAWHSGVALWSGRRRNINRISLGVTVERGPDGYSRASIAALAWLVGELRRRHDLPPAALVRWGDLKPRENDLADFPWEQLKPS
jgi:hypothetical protein